MYNMLLAILIFTSINFVTAVQAQPPELNDEAKDSFLSISDADHELLRARTLSALEAVHTELNQLGGVEQARFAHDYQLDALTNLLDAQDVDRKALRDIERSYYGLHRGPQVKSLRDLRTALTQELDFLYALESSNPRREFQFRVEALQAALKSHSPDTNLIGRHTAWMMAMGQSSQWIDALQKDFQHPSIVVDINPQLVLPMLADFERKIDKSEYAKNRIMGVPVEGESRMIAKVNPELLQSDHRLGVKLNLEGQIESPGNEAKPDPQRVPVIGNVSVKLKSRGVTEVKGAKEIYWNGLWLEALPAEVDCTTEAELKDVDISRQYRRPNRILAQRVDHQIRKRAYGEVKKNSDRTNAEAAKLASNLVSEQLDDEVASLLADANEKIDEFYVRPLDQLGLLPIGTGLVNPLTIRLGFRGAHGGGIAAPEALPIRKLKGDLELSAHESMGSNLWAGYLKGRRLTDREFKNVHRELRGFVPQALRLAGHTPWEVRMDEQSPLEIEFREGLITLKLRMQSVAIDNRVWDIPFSVSAQYHVATDADMPRFERIGEIHLNWREPDSSIDDFEILERFVLEKFDAFFANVMHLDGMSAPVGGAWGSAAELKIVESQVQNGWWRIIFQARDMNRLK